MFHKSFRLSLQNLQYVNTNFNLEEIQLLITVESKTDSPDADCKQVMLKLIKSFCRVDGNSLLRAVDAQKQEAVFYCWVNKCRDAVDLIFFLN